MFGLNLQLSVKVFGQDKGRIRHSFYVPYKRSMKEELFFVSFHITNSSFLVTLVVHTLIMTFIGIFATLNEF